MLERVVWTHSLLAALALLMLKEVLRVLCCAMQGTLPLPQHFAHSEALMCVCSELDPSCLFRCWLSFILVVIATWSRVLLNIMKEMFFCWIL